MPQFSVDKVSPGMILDEDVVHMNGRILMRAGNEITDKHIKILKTWGILTVNIAQDDQTTAGASNQLPVSPGQYRAAEERLKNLFRHADISQPALAEIFGHRVRESLDGKD